MELGTITFGPCKVGKTTLYNEIKCKEFSQVIFDEALFCQDGEVLVINGRTASIKKRAETVIYREFWWQKSKPNKLSQKGRRRRNRQRGCYAK